MILLKKGTRIYGMNNRGHQKYLDSSSLKLPYLRV